jgi:hypothetical protein
MTMNETDFGRESGVIDLDNGLRIHFYDQSRPIVGDRSFLKLLIRIPIRVLEDDFIDSGHSPAEYRLFIGETAGEVAFVQTKTRNFIATANAPAFLESMKQDFLQANRAYLSKPSFPRKFVLKAYGEWTNARTWQGAHREQVAAVIQKERESE